MWDPTEREVAELARLGGAARAAIRRSRPPSAAVNLQTRPAAKLTPRDREIVALLTADKTCKEVAVALSLSARTIEHHVERLKLRCRQTTLHGLVGYLTSHRP